MQSYSVYRAIGTEEDPEIPKRLWHCRQNRLERLLPPAQTPRTISKDAAIEDINTLLLRTNYGAYAYYGGDVFFPLFDGIIEVLNSQETWNTTNSGDFQALIHPALSDVIFDNHFAVNYRVLDAPSRQSRYFPGGTFANFFSSEADFIRTGNDFRSVENDLCITEIVGYNIDDILRLSITQAMLMCNRIACCQGELF